jgi:hypothetical protein
VGWFAALVLAALLASTWDRPVAGQTQQTERLMREKLGQSERLLAALVTSDWVALEGHGRALEALTGQPGWDVLRLPEYARHTAAFQRAARAVITAAGERDQHTALAAYTGLVASCVECHSYIARARIARLR